LQLIVNLRGTIERFRLTAREVHEIHAVAEMLGGVDGVREETTAVVKIVLVDVTDVAAGARREIPKEEIRSVMRRVRRALVRADRELLTALGELEARRVRHIEHRAAGELEELELAR